MRDTKKGEFVVIEEAGEYDLVEVMTVSFGERKMIIWHLRQVQKLNHDRPRGNTWTVSFNPDYENSPYLCWKAHEPSSSHILRMCGDLTHWMGE